MAPILPFLFFLGAFAIVLLGAQIGMKTGAWPALCGMLSTLLGVLAGLRYWFLVDRIVGQHEVVPVPWHVTIIFWVLVMAVIFGAFKVREEFTELLESTLPSVVDKILGWVFGLVCGAILAMALMMSVSVVAPEFLPGYRREQLPVPVDEWAMVGYRYIEQQAAGVGPKDKGHTVLPVLGDKAAGSENEFWR